VAVQHGGKVDATRLAGASERRDTPRYLSANDPRRSFRSPLARLMRAILATEIVA